MDRTWWDAHCKEVDSAFGGVRYSNNPQNKRYRCVHISMRAYGNSGAAAISLAALAGAKRIVMLGYDCQHTNGMTHWHGDHPKGLGNAAKIQNWPKKFQMLANDLTNVDIINASRESALQMFERAPLESVLV